MGNLSRNGALEKLDELHKIIIAELGDGKHSKGSVYHHLDSLRKDYQSLREENQKQSEKIDKIHTKLFENGLSSEVANLQEWKKSVNKSFNRVVIAVVCGVVLNIAGFFMQDYYATKRELGKIEILKNHEQNRLK